MEKVTIKISSDDNKYTDVTLDFNDDGTMDVNVNFEPKMSEDDVSYYSGVVGAVLSTLLETS